MPYSAKPQKRKKHPPSFYNLTLPLQKILNSIKPLVVKGNKRLKMSFQDQLNALFFFHLEEHHPGQHLLQALKEDNFARNI